MKRSKHIENVNENLLSKFDIQSIHSFVIHLHTVSLARIRSLALSSSERTYTSAHIGDVVQKWARKSSTLIERNWRECMLYMYSIRAYDRAKHVKSVKAWQPNDFHHLKFHVAFFFDEISSHGWNVRPDFGFGQVDLSIFYYGQDDHVSHRMCVDRVSYNKQQ